MCYLFGGVRTTRTFFRLSLIAPPPTSAVAQVEYLVAKGIRYLFGGVRTTRTFFRGWRIPYLFFPATVMTRTFFRPSAHIALLLLLGNGDDANLLQTFGAHRVTSSSREW
jgi:hypothetical protein